MLLVSEIIIMTTPSGNVSQISRNIVRMFQLGRSRSLVGDVFAAARSSRTPLGMSYPNSTLAVTKGNPMAANRMLPVK